MKNLTALEINMGFEITVKDAPEELIFDIPSKWCRITINNFSEDFAIPLDTWDVNKYQSQWLSSLKSIVGGSDKKCLITAMRDPRKSDFISLFALYRIGESVFVQNQIVMCEGNQSKIISEDFDSLIEEREIYTDDGEKISEWKTTIREIKI
jgi:hypothetical protein